MTARDGVADRIARQIYDDDLATDVLVIGGSLAGSWAALAARAAGADVILVDKGQVGTSGIVAAATGSGYFLLPDNPVQRERTIHIRHDMAEGLDDLGFCERVYEQSYRSFSQLVDWGFRPGRLGSFRGPDSMVFLRRRLITAGVRVLDRRAAIELLADSNGTIAGAAGVNRRTERSWRVRAGAVILATGGNAFRSGAIGTGGSTGDGYLFAAEAGVDMVGMEFSGHYAFVADGSSCTKGGMFHLYGEIHDEDGRKLDPQPGWPAVPAAGQAILAGKRVYATLRMDEERYDAARGMMPNFFTYFARTGTEPFNAPFPVSLIYEGTVRAAGGLIVDPETAGTSAPGLFAVGDVADKTRLTGAQMSGAGAAIAWCVASGEWAGRDAARFARQLGDSKADRRLIPLGQVGVRPQGGGAVRADAVQDRVRDEILPLSKNLYRTASGLTRSLDQLDGLWREAVNGLAATDGRDLVRAREAAAQVATARWMYRAGLSRTETRGLHRRADFPDMDPRQQRNLRVGGLEQISVWPSEADRAKASLPAEQV